ncbi:MAG TPA: hypothetical protein VHE55_04945 [Fimbriimonadaceae bacterium]|nr:hypothetical protein [Fimbriimonadaceae bacterium]
MIVGGIAVGFYSEPRFTKDLDILVAVRPPDHLKLLQVLKEFGAPVHLVRAEDFISDNFIFYFGSPPWRVDILTSIPGLEFEEAFGRRERMRLGSARVNCISKQDLIAAKRASGRHQDLADVEKLEGSS